MMRAEVAVSKEETLVRIDVREKEVNKMIEVAEIALENTVIAAVKNFIKRNEMSTEVGLTMIDQTLELLHKRNRAGSILKRYTDKMNEEKVNEITNEVEELKIGGPGRMKSRMFFTGDKVRVVCEGKEYDARFVHRTGTQVVVQINEEYMITNINNITRLDEVEI